MASHRLYNKELGVFAIRSRLQSQLPVVSAVVRVLVATWEIVGEQTILGFLHRRERYVGDAIDIIGSSISKSEVGHLGQHGLLGQQKGASVVEIPMALCGAISSAGPRPDGSPISYLGREGLVMHVIGTRTTICVTAYTLVKFL